MNIPFKKANILLPKSCDMTKWSVVACDQYTSEPEYWQDVEEIVGSNPSTLRLTLPEIYLEVVTKHCILWKYLNQIIQTKRLLYLRD